MRRKLTTALFAAQLLLACATAPVQEMSDARQAIAAAHRAGAEESAPGDLRAARELLSRAQTRLEEGDYETARRLATDARVAAMAARERATLGD